MSNLKDKRGQIIRRLVSDVVIIGGGGIVLLLFRFLGDPYKRGFFCNDETLNHPYKDSTVASGMLYGIGFALAAVMMVIVEAIWVYRDVPESPRQQHDISEYGKLRVIARDIYLSLVPFVFGAVLEHVVTDIGKYSIGRLRPHFLTICNLDYTKVNCSAGYIEDFECINADANRIREVRLSFPSGHASFSSYVALYLMMYLQRRLTFVFNSLIRPFLQTLLFTMAWYTCLSRVSDYKHHPTDVLAGAVIGVISAVLTAYCVSDMFKVKESRQMAQEYDSSLNKSENGSRGITTVL